MRPEGTILTADEVSEIKRYTKNLSQYLQEQAIVFQQIALMIPNSLYLKIKKDNHERSMGHAQG